MLSAASMVYALVRLLLYLFGGSVADATSPVVAVGALGAAFLAGIAAVRALGSPVGRGAAEDSASG